MAGYHGSLKTIQSHTIGQRNKFLVVKTIRAVQLDYMATLPHATSYYKKNVSHYRYETTLQRIMRICQKLSKPDNLLMA